MRCLHRIGRVRNCRSRMSHRVMPTKERSPKFFRQCSMSSRLGFTIVSLNSVVIPSAVFRSWRAPRKLDCGSRPPVCSGQGTLSICCIRHRRWEEMPEATLASEVDATLLPPDIEDAYPMSQLQLGMVYHGQLDAATAVYHDIFSYRVNGPFDAAKLNRAIQMLAERHSILRTSFELSKFSRPMQLVHRQVQIPCDVEDIRHLFAAEQDTAIEKWIEQEKA